jgi:outer membrane protein assembly factor BamE
MKSPPACCFAPVVLLLAAPLLTACSGVPILPGLLPYKMEIQQGNYVTQEMVSRLKPGMTRDQVRFIMGTPLVADIFHAERWDYVYTRVPERGGPLEERRVAVFFKDDKLTRLEGDVVAQSGVK